MSIGQWWNDTYTGRRTLLGEKPVPVPISSPQISRGLSYDRIRASSARGRRLTVVFETPFDVTSIYKLSSYRTVNIHSPLHGPTVLARHFLLLLPY
jgi:hypothetical protein